MLIKLKRKKEKYILRILFYPFVLVSAAINKVQLEATNFPLLQLNAAKFCQICKFGKKGWKANKFGRHQLNACLTFRRTAIELWSELQFSTDPPAPSQHFQQTFCQV